MEDLGNLATSWRIKGTSSIIFSQAKSFGLSYLYHISIAPPCGNMNSTHLHWKLLAPLHVLVLFLACVCICCASYLLNLRNQVVCWLYTMYVCFVFEPIASCCILIGSCEILMYYFMLGECDVLGNLTILNVCTWGIPLRIDISRLSSLYVVCHAHEKFKFYNVH